MVFALPIPKLLAIQVQDKRRKALVVLTFLVGLFVTICSMVRIKYLSQVSQIVNATYDFTEITLWSAIESGVGVICACMPTIIGPALAMIRKTFDSTANSFSKSGTFGKSGTTKSAMNSSHVSGDRGVERLPSSSNEPDMESGDLAQQHGGIEKTTETSVYHLPAYMRASDDDVELLPWKR
jgi:hypothetical protein